MTRYNGTSDLYPKKARELINNDKFNDSAIEIQRWWRATRKVPKVVQTEKPRFWSWFPVIF